MFFGRFVSTQKVHFAVFGRLVTMQKVHFAVFGRLVTTQKARFAVFGRLVTTQKARWMFSGASSAIVWAWRCPNPAQSCYQVADTNGWSVRGRPAVCCIRRFLSVS